jgi:hypothetical protein
MTKRAASESDDYLSPKEEPTTPPPTTPKKAKKSPPTPSTTSSRTKNDNPGNGIPGSLAKSARGRYMELIFEAGLKAVNKKVVQDEVSCSNWWELMYQTGLSPAQQNEMVRKDKGPLRRAMGGSVGGL